MDKDVRVIFESDACTSPNPFACNVCHRLDSPAAKYAPWFKVPLKAARLAVKIIGLLEDQKRAARLSFADVVKRLAEQEEGSPTFISKKVGGLVGGWVGGWASPACSPPV